MRDLRARLAEKHPDVTVWAAGGLVLRDAGGELEILIVHRPDHGDWSFPKGKLDEGETLGRAATPTPLLFHTLAALAIATGGSDEQKRAWLPKLATGDALGTVALADVDGAWQPEE